MREYWEQNPQSANEWDIDMETNASKRPFGNSLSGTFDMGFSRTPSIVGHNVLPESQHWSDLPTALCTA